jgi:hypothetical protein
MSNNTVTADLGAAEGACSEAVQRALEAPDGLRGDYCPFGYDPAKDEWRAETVTGRRTDWPLADDLPPLAPFASAPRTARALMGDTLENWQLARLDDEAGLVVSELMTNAIQVSTGKDGKPISVPSGMPWVQLRMRSDGAALLIEVCDMVPGVEPVMTCADADAEGGRGLGLVDSLTGGDWGWETAPDGRKCVWAVLKS